jgi:hypothetical protein
MKYPILIGSQALKHYVKLPTLPSDWDFIAQREKSYFRIDTHKIDIISSQEKSEPTNQILFDLAQKSTLIVDTPIGKAKVMPLELLKVLKLSSLPQNKTKHKKHLELMRKVKLNTSLLKIAKQRTLETKKRSKKQFFNKYKIPRFFDHDELHLFLNKTPAYKQILKDEVNIYSKKFNKLSLKNKKLVLFEEAFVLGLERYLVPKIRQNPFLVNYYANEFFKLDSNDNVGIYWLNKLCQPNGLKDHPIWLQKWAYKHYDELLSDYKAWWTKSFDKLPESFWKRLLA